MVGANRVAKEVGARKNYRPKGSVAWIGCSEWGVANGLPVPLGLATTRIWCRLGSQPGEWRTRSEVVALGAGSPYPPLSDFAIGTSNPGSHGIFAVEAELSQVSNDYGTESLWILDKTASGKTVGVWGLRGHVCVAVPSPCANRPGASHVLISRGPVLDAGHYVQGAQAEVASHQGIRHELDPTLASTPTVCCLCD